MESVASAAGASLKVTTYDDYLLHEKDLVSVNNSGRELFGEAMDMTLSRDFSFNGITGITNDDGKVTLRFIAKPTSGNGSVTMSCHFQRSTGSRRHRFHFFCTRRIRQEVITVIGIGVIGMNKTSRTFIIIPFDNPATIE